VKTEVNIDEENDKMRALHNVTTYTRVQGGKERAPTQLTIFKEDFSKFGIMLPFPPLHQK